MISWKTNPERSQMQTNERRIQRLPKLTVKGCELADLPVCLRAVARNNGNIFRLNVTEAKVKCQYNNVSRKDS